tara:strand:+ start:262 stop:2892 length:2631 start_codon:yes stop_codon:yes gene_type:complete
MARRSSRGSVYNKRSNEQVQTARTSGVSQGGILPQAYAQSSNPTQNQSPQARTQSTQFDPWARATQFVHNVGRGGYDVGRSYTTDIADTAHAIATGREQEERSYRDETLATVFGRGLFEGNLEGSFAEASRRVQEQPGRVVGEVAAEAAILAGTMGFGAVVKGAKVGMTGVKSVRGATKAQGSTGWIRKTGLIRKGQEQKFIGDKTTTIIKTNKKGKVTTKTKKTNILDRMERFGAKGGERFGNKIGRPTTLGSPMIIGASGKGAMTGDDMIKANKLVDEVDEKLPFTTKQRMMDDLAIEVRGWDSSPPTGGGTSTSGMGGGFTKDTVNLDMSYPIKLGDDVDPAFIGSMYDPVQLGRDNLGRNARGQNVSKPDFFKVRQDEILNTIPAKQTTDKVDEDLVTQVVDKYNKTIDENPNIRESDELGKLVNETIDVRNEDTIRTQISSFPVDKSAAKREAEATLRMDIAQGKTPATVKKNFEEIMNKFGIQGNPEIIKTNTKKGFVVPENTALGSETSLYGFDSNNQVSSVYASSITQNTFIETGFTELGLSKLVATGKILGRGGSKTKTGRAQYWAEQSKKGGSTTIDYGLPSADDKQISGVADGMMNVDEWVIGMQPNPTVKRFVGNNEEAILKEAERVAQAKKNESFYNVFSTKWNEGSLAFQGGKKPSQKLPSRWVDYLEIKGMDESGYTGLSIKTGGKFKDEAQAKQFVRGDVPESTWTGSDWEESVWTRPNFEAAGSVGRKGDMLPVQNLVREIPMVNRNRITQSVGKSTRIRNKNQPKTIVEKDESLVAFDINRVRELARIQGTTAVKKRISKPRRAVSKRGSKPKSKPDKVTSFSDIGQLGGNFGVNPETGNIDMMTRQSSYRMPSWYRL